MSDLKHRIIETNGIKMHIAEQGEGPLVVLLHGFPETWYSWRYQIPVLAEQGFHVVAPDLRGFGDTEQPKDIDQYTILHLVGDIVGLLDALNEETAVIVGNDWGATVAWNAALLRPDRFRGIVALTVPMMPQPPIPPTTVFPQSDKELFYTLYFQTPGVAEKEFEKDIYSTVHNLFYSASGDAGPRKGNDGTPNPFSMVSREKGLLSALPMPKITSWLKEEDLKVYEKAFKKTGFSGGLNYYRNLDRNRELLSCFNGMKVTIPAQFIVGSRDVGLSMPGMDQIILDMHKLVPNLRKNIFIEDCGHWAQQEKPKEISAAIISFMKSL
ncbi:alpha/beta fold hydrolase [Clostridium folliculivorans]|uniref:Epoxide hydrolase n=1 Tax=Clostridium folliculivorans TaxID=2886038 RepID=A0A9W5Y6D5_9CLOT|nr:alpha/beta hydrolase [Clostridium folliculivorans]GKU27412.1 epoxide hydrolase [Clostridium folliculivorans]GKU32263.1 epoxide hydrolase [Clostridium folliculivorans]